MNNPRPHRCIPCGCGSADTVPALTLPPGCYTCTECGSEFRVAAAPMCEIPGCAGEAVTDHDAVMLCAPHAANLKTTQTVRTIPTMESQTTPPPPPDPEVPDIVGYLKPSFDARMSAAQAAINALSATERPEPGPPATHGGRRENSGREKVPARKKLSEALYASVTLAEKRDIDSQAAVKNMTTSNYIRRRLGLSYKLIGDPITKTKPGRQTAKKKVVRKKR